MFSFTISSCLFPIETFKKSVKALNSCILGIWVWGVVARCISVVFPVVWLMGSHREYEICFLVFNHRHKHCYHPFQKWTRHQGTCTIYNMDEYYFFKDCECQEAVVTFEDSDVLWERKIWIERGWSQELIVSIKLFENVCCNIWGFARSNMCYTNNWAVSPVVGQWKINFSLLVCSKSLPVDGGNNFSSSQSQWLEEWPMNVLPVGSSSSLHVPFYRSLKSERTLNKGSNR